MTSTSTVTIEPAEVVEFETTVGVRVLDAMRRGLVDEFNVGGIPLEDLTKGMQLIELLYDLRYAKREEMQEGGGGD